MFKSYLRRPHAAPASYLPAQVARAYQLPAGLDGTGQTVGVIELGGSFSQADLSAYLHAQGLPDVQAVCVNVAGGSQQSDPGGADVEVMLDCCIIAALAPKAALRVYFAPNSDAGFAAAVARAVQDGCDVISISWGGPEDQWSPQGRQAMDNVLSAAQAHGVAVYVAAGDNGASDGEQGNHADYPASSPYAVGCGGTRLLLAADGSIASETVWNDGPGQGATGGGFSAVYSKPEYQASVAGTMRGVPDVAGVADPETGWTIRADGRDQSVGGTSAVAPMWSAIHALLCRRAGKRLGPVPALYYQHPEACRDVVGGDNQGYPAAAGWDPATGLGSPNGPALFALAGGTPAPTPTPPANPPAPGSAPLLTLTFPRGVARGQWVRFRSPVALSPGKYGLAAEAA